MLSFSLPAHVNDEFNMHKSKGDCEYSMLMAITHVQMAAARYRGDINIVSLFPTPTPAHLHNSLCLQYTSCSLSNGPALSEGKL